MEGVLYVTYKKEKLPVRLSYRAIKALKSETKTFDVSKVGTFDPELLETMLYHGLVSGHKYEEKELKYKKEDMEDILDACMMEFMALIPQFFPKAKMGNVTADLEKTLTVLDNNKVTPDSPE